jgi:dipeptidyl aminopeptidase/acylaminoacyl peptidase
MFEYNALKKPAITPLGFAKDPNFLFYSAYQNDKKALFKIHLASKKTNDVIGIYHTNSEDGRVYWDNSIGHFQKSLNQAFPDSDVYLVDFSQNENICLPYTENDFTPGMYYLGNRKDKYMTLILEQYPMLEPEVLTEHKFVTYTTRDGAKLEGCLTLPLNADGPVPTILYPRDGLGTRKRDGFDHWISFFVNRGYAIFRPNFRGSSGYGDEFAESQMQGWGLTMQDDLADAAKWLVVQKFAESSGMCIVGSSYGGYAAAMAAVKTPELFKCAVSFTCMTNLKQLVIQVKDTLTLNLLKIRLLMTTMI